ncbi:DHA1 family bicyclomycin/chloramphenicol resistance-like MFS transporter [Gemmobacter caeni]|uniref:Bcr/CflA family efflux transporter n=1 Tax=Gemmobacter caeni TaxID=589035 RepID=A0A2T6BAL5_9RHOB|nr:Bcr/CflA family efflux MFS transporter [Gemmobacter caeni]PTX53117.1 DHA1 family bicyclomycin/chloramphenicol resistance-like MFS transporter [Gemmobacter caeni]TWJ05228.1 DHA1 family bicyclomycin/chloramphenicol resistance-like MFS transporter [Gemmobacter caeni]
MTTRRLSQPEFIAMIAFLFALIAFSIDAMLPALPQIALELTPDATNRAQLIVTSFVLGMGLGTFFAGPLSDSLGRKRVILGGGAIYAVAAIVAHFAPTLETVLAARVVQGIGAAGPRVVSLALVRDLYKGREMARIVSFAMMIFTLVPAVAPLIGSFIIAGFGWRAIFLGFLCFAAVPLLWLTLRQPETLLPAARRPLSVPALVQALREVLTNRIVVIAMLAQTFCFAALFGTLSSTQQIFDTTFGRAESFPFWFALIAILSGSASVINATLVVRLGMRLLISTTLAAQVALSLCFALISASDLLPPDLYFGVYVFWTITVFMVAGLTLGNLNALALEPVGHIAGMAASVTGSLATVVAVAIAAPLGLAFDGTPVPLAFGVCALTAAGFLLMKLMPGR